MFRFGELVSVLSWNLLVPASACWILFFFLGTCFSYGRRILLSSPSRKYAARGALDRFHHVPVPGQLVCHSFLQAKEEVYL